MKIFCVGRNYVAHARELKNAVPEEPLIFMKGKNALLQNNMPFYYPDFSQDIHYECEIVVQVCSNGKYVEKKFAHRYYDKVSLGIDFTARDLQQKLKKAGHPWEIAKAFDDSAVIGDWLHVSEIGDLSHVDFHLDKNGEMVQTGNSENMIFSVEDIIVHISKYFTINIGDLIYTGTPAGVGPVRPGDRLEGYFQNRKMFEVEIK